MLLGYSLAYMHMIFSSVLNLRSINFFYFKLNWHMHKNKGKARKVCCVKTAQLNSSGRITCFANVQHKEQNELCVLFVDLHLLIDVNNTQQ